MVQSSMMHQDSCGDPIIHIELKSYIYNDNAGKLDNRKIQIRDRTEEFGCLSVRGP